MRDTEAKTLQPPPVTPYHSVAVCPLCGGGLCGIRICDGDDPTQPPPGKGFVLCDECEAVWIDPDVGKNALYLDHENPKCPICQAGLWNASHWAEIEEVEALDWAKDIDPSLNQ